MERKLKDRMIKWAFSLVSRTLTQLRNLQGRDNRLPTRNYEWNKRWSQRIHRKKFYTCFKLLLEGTLPWTWKRKKSWWHQSLLRRKLYQILLVHQKWLMRLVLKVSIYLPEKEILRYRTLRKVSILSRRKKRSWRRDQVSPMNWQTRLLMMNLREILERSRSRIEVLNLIWIPKSHNWRSRGITFQ